MKQRLFFFNLIIVIIFASLILGYQYYDSIKNEIIGPPVNEKLGINKQQILEKLASIQLSAYSTQNKELNQVRNDIMNEFDESDFASIIIQPKASFIDSLLYDSELVDYMNNSRLSPSNKSLLNKMKLYLPNEMLVSFHPKRQTIEQIEAIENYLLKYDYVFINGSEIPSVKSNIRHYYYDKALYKDLVDQLNIVDSESIFLTSLREKIRSLEYILGCVFFIILTLLIQLVDFYQYQKNREKTAFLLKGHCKFKNYRKTLFLGRSIILLTIFIITTTGFFFNLQPYLYFSLDKNINSFIGLTTLINLLIITFKKERIEN